MQDELRRKLSAKEDSELRLMVGSPEYARWAQEIAVELLVARGHPLELPPLPPPPPPGAGLPVRKLLVAVGVALGLAAATAAYYAYLQHRRDEATLPVRQFVERLSAIASGLPAAQLGESLPADASARPLDSLGPACAQPLEKISSAQVVGLILMPKAISARFAKEVRLGSWTLVASRGGSEPVSFDELALESDSVDRYLERSSVSYDQSWSTKLPQRQELEAFRYVAISRVLQVVPPNITRVTRTGADAQVPGAPFASEEVVDVQGELGRASLDVTLVDLSNQAVVCRGRIENVGPTGYSSFGYGPDDRAAWRDAVNPQRVAVSAWVMLERKLARAWLSSLCSASWPEVCPRAD